MSTRSLARIHRRVARRSVRKKNANLPKALFAVANVARRNGNSDAASWNSGRNAAP